MVKKTNKKKLTILLIMAIIIFFALFIPTLARLINRVDIITVKPWDGEIATKYKSGLGTEEKPFEISNAKEFAFFKEQLKTTDYNNVYFEITNDIYLNEGFFKYVDNEIVYLIDNKNYKIKKHTNEYYEDDYKVGEIYDFESMNNFKGNLNGNFYRVYGLYITSEEENVGLFQSLEGLVENLYIENSIIHGGNISGALAGISKNASVKNVYTDAIVINGSIEESLTYEENLINQEFEINNFNLNDYLNIKNKFIETNSEIIKIQLSGKTSLSGVYLANQLIDNEFSIELSSLDNVLITLNHDQEEGILNFTDLRLVITYKNQFLGGIIGLSENTVLTNSLSKSVLYGDHTIGGITGAATQNFTIKNSYSTNYELVSLIEKGNTVLIENCINVSEKNLIKNILNTDVVELNNIINYSDIYLINNITNSEVTIENSFSVVNKIVNHGTYDGIVSINTKLNIFDMLNDLNYLEYFDKYKIDDNLVWVYDEKIPKLFIDDIKSGELKLYSGIYSWTNFSMDLNELSFKNHISFDVKKNEINSINTIEYYISEDILTKVDLSQVQGFVELTNFAKITKEGSYIIYIKVTTLNNEVYYLNSDILNLTIEDILSVSYDNESYYSYETNRENIYIQESITLDVSNDLSLEGYYYISTNPLTRKELTGLSNKKWISLPEFINIDYIGNNYVYIKYLIDDKFEYINTDNFKYKGFNINYHNELLLSNKSIITMNVDYEDDVILNDIDQYLVSNKIIPLDTKITLYNNLDNKIYTYLVNENYQFVNNSYRYNFNNFKEVGKINSYYEIDSFEIANYKLKIDFTNINIIDDLSNLKLFFIAKNEDYIVSTYKKDIPSLDIYNINNSLFLTTDFNEDIYLNSNSYHEVDLNIMFNKNDVYLDNSFDLKSLGLEVEILNKYNNKVNFNNVEMVFKNRLYNFKNNSVFIKLNDNVTSFNDILKIFTNESNILNDQGVYKIRIHLVTLLDNYYLKDYYNFIDIPLIVDNVNKAGNYSYKIINENYVLNKELDNNMIGKILLNGEFKNPVVKISLFEKSILSAYDQSYSLINLNNYLNSSLSGFNNVYNLVESLEFYNSPNYTLNDFELKFKKNKFNKTSYKLEYYLYDGDVLIDTIIKTFIVR